MLLLDSQVVLWLLDDNPRLGARARHAISSAAAVHVSVASVWELTIKAMLGKLSVPDMLVTRLAEQGLVLLSITAEPAEGVREFPELVRHDPVRPAACRAGPPCRPAAHHRRPRAAGSPPGLRHRRDLVIVGFD